MWGGKGDVLCIDPATAIRESRKATTAYNDFPNLKWLGLRQGQTPIFNPAESGRWVCVESHVKLNTPGQPNGVFELWVDGKLDASRKDLDWHGSWGDYGINAVFLENYWNQGALKREARWFNNLAISTERIGPITASKPPTLFRTELPGSQGWEIEVATDSDARDIVWKSNPMEASAASVTVDGAHGAFAGSCAGKQALSSSAIHWVRIREVGQPEWSPSHMPFRSSDFENVP